MFDKTPEFINNLDTMFPIYPSDLPEILSDVAEHFQTRHDLSIELPKSIDIQPPCEKINYQCMITILKSMGQMNYDINKSIHLEQFNVSGINRFDESSTIAKVFGRFFTQSSLNYLCKYNPFQGYCAYHNATLESYVHLCQEHERDPSIEIGHEDLGIASLYKLYVKNETRILAYLLRQQFDKQFLFNIQKRHN